MPHASQLQALRTGIRLKARDRASDPSISRTQLEPQRPHRHMRSAPANDARVQLRPIDAQVVGGGQEGTACVLQLRLREGVNREVRRVCEHFGWPLLSLSRASYGPWLLADLPDGQLEEVPQKLLQLQLRDMNVTALGRAVA